MTWNDYCPLPLHLDLIQYPNTKCTQPSLPNLHLRYPLHVLYPKTVNPLDPRRGNFDSLRGWVCFQTHWRWETQQIQHPIGWWWSELYDWLIWGCQDPADPASDWLIVVQALSLVDLRVPRVADSKVGCQIAFSWPVLAKSSPFI